MAEEFDIVIKGGHIIDGTGNPWFGGDIGIGKGKVKKIGFIRGKGRETIDADGMVISPGFVDLHNHSDLSVLAFPNCENYIMQGVTVAVVGNCGLSMAPVNPQRLELLKEYLLPLLPLDGDYGWDWKTLKEYYEKVEERKISLNLVPLVGHGALRIAVKGFEKSEPSKEEMNEMKQLLAESLEDGAFGMSTGLIYPPGCYSTTEELVELGGVLKKYGRIYTSHIRNESTKLAEAVKEAIRIGEENNIPVEVSHHKAKGEENWGKVDSTLRLMGKARERGVEVNCDVYPYTAGSTIISALLPIWVLEGGIEKMVERLKSKEIRERIKEEFVKDRIEGENYFRDAGFNGIFVASCPSNKEYEGKSLMEIIRHKNRLSEPYEALFDLLLEIRGNSQTIHFMLDEEDVKKVISSPLSSICSDSWAMSPTSPGKPHPRAYGAFPKVLGRYVREEKILRIEEAIRKMTSLPASKVRLKNRGLLKEGFWADITIFDPAKIKDTATYQDPQQYPTGIKYVIVNGGVSVEDGKLTYAKFGKILKFNGGY